MRRRGGPPPTCIRAGLWDDGEELIARRRGSKSARRLEVTDAGVCADSNRFGNAVLHPSICAAVQTECQATITHPRAWYKPADIDRARANIDRHGWARRLHDGYRQSAAFYLEHDPEFLAAFVPQQTPLLTIPCPKCGAGPWYWGQLSADGETLSCTSCKTAYPRDPEDRSETWNVQSVLRAERIARIAEGLDVPAILYQLDGERRCAERIAPIIERFAETFQHYRMNKVNANVWLDRNDHYYGKIAGWKHRDGSVLHKFLKAYDLTRDSGVFSEAQKEKIDRGLVRYALDYFLEGYGPTGPLSLQYNTQDQGYPWLCVTAAAAMLDDRQAMGVMRDVWERMVDPANGIFFEDGAFYQCTPGYNWMLLNSSLGLPDILRGGIRPAIYDSPRCARLENVYTWFLDATFPDRTMPALNDGHVQDRTPPVFAEVAWLNFGNRKALRYMKEAWGEELDGGTEYSLFYRDPDSAASGAGADYATDSVHLPGIGLMILRHGEPKAEQTMALLDYGPWAPQDHKHQDYLNFDLFACGLEMIPEYGYPWNPTWSRLWGRSPQAHKTIVEATDQPERGDPLIWCVTPGPQLAEAGRPPRNSRCIVLLPRSAGKPLVVDIFRVALDNVQQLAWTTSARSPTCRSRESRSWRRWGWPSR